MVCQVVAPMDSAASKIPESTSRTDCSIRRAIKGAMKIVRGTSAAVVPIEEPTITRVKGKIATIKIMKGSERTVLTTKFTTSYNHRIGRNPPGRLSTKITPSAAPKSVPTSKEMRSEEHTSELQSRGH